MSEEGDEFISNASNSNSENMEIEEEGINEDQEETQSIIQQQEQPKSQVTINQKVGDRTCATYNFKGEDHTLGNLLRFSLIKNPDVEFCGYSITHPSENEMNLRLQTTGKIF